MRRIALTVVAASTLMLGGCGAPALQQPAPPQAVSPRPPLEAGGESDVAALEAVCAAEPPEGEVFEQDAQAYADEFGVSLDEAMNRLALQDVTGVQEAGVAAAPELWAGYWLEHEPAFGYVLFYKGEPADVAPVQAVVADCSIPIIVRSGAQFSELELLEGMDRLSASGRLAPPMPGLSMYPDVRTGSIVLGGPTDPGPDVLAQIADIAGVPVRYVEEAALTRE